MSPIFIATMVIDVSLLDQLSEEARCNPRLRKNYDLRSSVDDCSQRMLNALEPGTVMPIHRHRTSSESVMVLRGSIRQNFYNSDGKRTSSWILASGTATVGCQIPVGQWHNLECLEAGTVIFEAKDGPWEPLCETDILYRTD